KYNYLVLTSPTLPISEPIPYPNNAIPVPNKDISKPPFNQLFFANLPLIAPIKKENNKLIEIAINNAIKFVNNPVLTIKYGIIGRIPPIKKDTNMTIAPLNGEPIISKFKPSSSVSIVFNHTSLFDIILFTTMSSSAPEKP